MKPKKNTFDVEKMKGKRARLSYETNLKSEINKFNRGNYLVCDSKTSLYYFILFVYVVILTILSKTGKVWEK